MNFPILLVFNPKNAIFIIMSSSNKIVLIKDKQYGLYYYKDNSKQDDDELVILWLFFTTCLRFDLSFSVRIKKLLNEHDQFGCGDLGIEYIDGKLQIYHDLIEDLKEPRLSKEELVALIDKWYELVAAQPDKIIITHQDGKFTLSAE